MRSSETSKRESPLPPPVLTKLDFVRRYEAGEFGNHSPTWNGFTDWAMAHLGGDKLELFHIRNRIAGGPTWYDVAKFEMADRWAEATLQVPSDKLYISAMCPTQLTTIQGELMESPDTGELRLYYSDVKKPMRQSLIEGGRQVGAAAARNLLQSYLNPRSLSWLYWLLSGYPGHVIEFTALSRCWGSEPGHNTLFWEVRRY